MGAKTSGRMRQVVAVAFPALHQTEEGWPGEEPQRTRTAIVEMDKARVRILGPFRNVKAAESWLAGREFVFEGGLWAREEHDRPGDGEFWWGELDGKTVAVEVWELV